MRNASDAPSVAPAETIATPFARPKKYPARDHHEHGRHHQHRHERVRGDVERVARGPEPLDPAPERVEPFAERKHASGEQKRRDHGDREDDLRHGARAHGRIISGKEDPSFRWPVGFFGFGNFSGSRRSSDSGESSFRAPASSRACAARPHGNGIALLLRHAVTSQGRAPQKEGHMAIFRRIAVSLVVLVLLCGLGPSGRRLSVRHDRRQGARRVGRRASRRDGRADEQREGIQAHRRHRRDAARSTSRCCRPAATRCASTISGFEPVSSRRATSSPPEKTTSLAVALKLSRARGVDLRHRRDAARRQVEHHRDTTTSARS